DAHVHADEEDRGDDRDRPADPVDAAGVVHAQRATHPVAGQGTQHTEDDGPQDAEVLVALHEEPGERADDGSEDDETNDLHGSPSAHWAPPWGWRRVFVRNRGTGRRGPHSESSQAGSTPTAS